jgi:hypothetical protein
MFVVLSSSIDRPEFLLRIFESIYVVGLAGWIGAMAFFSFGLAPLIFRILEPQPAGRLVRGVFPRYYAWVAICAGLAAASLVCAALVAPPLRGPVVAIQSGIAFIGLFLMLYCGNILTPAVNAARDGGEPEKKRFDSLHRTSVNINSFVLLLGIGLLVAFVIRRPAGPVGSFPPVSTSEYNRRNLEAYNQSLQFWREHAEIAKREQAAKQQNEVAVAKSKLRALRPVPTAPEGRTRSAAGGSAAPKPSGDTADSKASP